MPLVKFGDKRIRFPEGMPPEEIQGVLEREKKRAQSLAQLFMQEMGQSQDGGAAPRMGQGQDREFSNQEKLDMAATTTMGLPIVGDVAGLAADFHMYATDEGSRNWINYLFTAAGMLPFVPAASQIKRLAGVLDVSELPAPHTALHGSPSLDRIENYDLSHPKRTDYGYLGEGVYATDVENRFIAKAYAGDGGKILDVEMPAGRYADFLYDENYRDNIENFARELGVDAEPKTSAWAAQFSEKMRDAGYVGARGLADDGSMIEAVIYQNKKKPKKIIAYHGSPHDFEKFSMDKIGTGEGAQAYGHGLYFAESEVVAQDYKSRLSNKNTADGFEFNGVNSRGRLMGKDGTEKPLSELTSNKEIQKAIEEAAFQTPQGGNVKEQLERNLGFQRRKAEMLGPERGTDAIVDAHERALELLDFKSGGHMYQVEIDATPDELLDWDAPLSEQPEKVREAFVSIVGEMDEAGKRVGKQAIDEDYVGGSLVRFLADDTAPLRARGIKGIKYKDGFSRGTDGGTSNYVIFDDRLITIAKKYGVAIPVAAGILAKETGEDTEQSYREIPSGAI